MNSLFTVSILNCTSQKAALGRQDVIPADSPEKSKESKEIDPQGRKNSPKSGQDRIGQVFVYVIAGSNGFERVAVLPIGSVRKAAFHDSEKPHFLDIFSYF